jgi:hypothetical protein
MARNGIAVILFGIEMRKPTAYRGIMFEISSIPAV